MSIYRHWSRAGEEPALAEVLSDPIVLALMQRDRVTQAELRAVIARAQAKLPVEPCRCAA
jgi:hypothetical protein